MDKLKLELNAEKELVYNNIFKGLLDGIHGIKQRAKEHIESQEKELAILQGQKATDSLTLKELNAYLERLDKSRF